MLHTVNKSPFERGNLESCLRLSRSGSSILLYEDGVYAALSDTAMTKKVENAMKDRSLYVLGPDLAARGIGEDRLISGITIVDYGGFVDLAADNGPVQSWL